MEGGVVIGGASFWTSVIAIQVSILSFVVSALTLYLSRRRRVQVTAIWEAKRRDGEDEPLWGIRVFVQNEASRPIQLQEVGVVYGLGDDKERVGGAAREG